MDEKALAVLEFPAVRERLARLAAFSAGRALVLALRPSSDRETVVRWQRETAEAVHLDRLGVDVPLGGAHDVRALAEGAARGQVLAVSDLLDIASAVRATQRVGRVFERVAEDVPLLAEIAEGIADLGPLRIVIEESIGDRGDVLDSASPELASIRREIGVAHDRLQQRMQALLNTAGVRAALQEPLITMREGRYVLPVRAESRGAVRGVVHDTSASGATVYVEPLAVVDLANRWRELQLQERHEVERVLREISAAVGESADDLREAVERLAYLDLAVAKARLARELRARDLAVPGAQAWLVDAPAELRLLDARHPLLEGDVVANTIVAGGDYRALLITGPNTGGKTVALKTAGLLCAMALAGMPVPAAEGSQVPVYEQVFADIGDEQSIEQSLSTFSGHMTAIIDIIERADSRSLVLLDELGAGTDPTEGAALAIAIVERLVEVGVTLIATTHHSELKLYAHQTPNVANASVEFDVETLTPTYRLHIGLPGQSNALAIASRLGMPDDVIETAREGISTSDRDVESLLADLRLQLLAAEERATRAQENRAEAERLRDESERRLAELVEESEQMRVEAQERVRSELRETERLLERARRRVEVARLEQAAADLERAQQLAASLGPEQAPEPVPSRPVRRRRLRVVERVDPAALLPGHSVWLRGISLPGEVLSMPDEDGEFEVRLGSLRTRVRMQQIERTEPRPPAEAVAAAGVRTAPPAEIVRNEIEVRGQRLDEAVPAVDRYLDQAARAGYSRVRVIHGRGTGTLRKAVRDLLEHHPLVTSFETAERTEGGEGVTIAHLAGE